MQANSAPHAMGSRRAKVLHQIPGCATPRITRIKRVRLATPINPHAYIGRRRPTDRISQGHAR